MIKNRLLIVLLLICCFTFSPSAPLVNASGQPNTEQSGLRQPELKKASDFDSGEIYTSKLSATYLSDWEKYTSYYYYNQLSDTEKSFYDKMNAMCISYLESDADLEERTDFCVLSGGTLDEAYKVALIFFYSNPQYYFLSPTFYYISYNDGYAFAFGIYEAFRDGDSRADATDSMKTVLDSYMEQINAEDTVIDKVKKAHDLIVCNTVYEFNTYDQSAYSALVLGKTVCAGYAASLSMLCNAADIDALVVTSDVHAWNYIRINDSWYNFDATWNDYDGSNGIDVIYTYFGKSQATILDSAHTVESFWAGITPATTLDSSSNYYGVGEFYVPEETVSTPVVKISSAASGNTVTISSALEDAVIYYTTDGTVPTVSYSKTMLYTGSFTTSSSNIKAIAVKDTYADSAVATAVVEEPDSSDDAGSTGGSGSNSGSGSSSSSESSSSSGSTGDSVVAAAKPVISTQPQSKTYTYNATTSNLSVKASVSDGGTLSYQWYKNSSNKTSGGTLIKNAVKSTYKPSSSTVGTTYYYCVVTNTKNNTKTTATSSAAKVVVKARSISSASVSGIKSKTYTGSAIKQSITVKVGQTKLTSGKDYTVSYKNNKKIGQATITITGKGNYTGSLKKTFTILPKKASITKVATTKKKLTVTWKKDTQVSGYQIQYSKSKSFSKYQTVKVKSNKTTKTTISKLSSSKTYYVRVRSYKTVNGKTYYGSYSTIKKIKVK